MTEQSKPPPQPPPPPPATLAASAQESKLLVRGVMGLVAVVVVAIGYGLYQSDGQFLMRLQDTAVSRGLITFLVAVVTVAIALILGVWVLVSNADGDELKTRFGYAKDVLASLIGILGTVLGFYFGSAEKSAAQPPVMAEVQFKGDQAILYTTGGTPPYRYLITLADSRSALSRDSKDGWHFEPLPAGFDAGAAMAVEVIDSKGQRVTQQAKLPGAQAAADAASKPASK